MGMIDVKEFGAAGDGVADDTAAIQKALDAAAPQKAGVWVPGGTYNCSTLRMHPYTQLCGQATYSYRNDGGSILRLSDPKARCLINCTGALGANITGLCLAGGSLGEGVHGILYDKPDYGKEEDAPHIDHCRVSGFTGDGVHLGRIWCFSVRHCMLSHNKGSGLLVRGWDGFVLDNWLSGNHGAGYLATDENASITMTGNRIEWNRLGGIVIAGGTHYNIVGNYIDRSGGPGIDLQGRPDRPCRIMAISGNVIYRSGKPDWRPLDQHDSCHVRMRDCGGVTCTGNTLNIGRDDGGKGEWSPNYGMVLQNLWDCVVKDNVMSSGALKELIVDLGGHTAGTIIRDNPGALHVPTE